ncbi:hypothetical protein H8F21_13445 [Pseudomonas sp. P66]|uniref:Uncharacterized protein n=1 Tax=Pseudomonas arcuscaelestis TaxID=2710591 RepID=A0ABS2BY76_9PSED|nr:hypothetical protein [Pseudomonas arcuscaelestis]MBM5458568.1 hypothetical protein [Pseudomonas arcuscaelestis]
MELLHFQQTDNGTCRVYYKDAAKKIVCYKPSHIRGQYALFACSRDGEPSHEIAHQNFKVDFLPVAEDGATAIEFTSWYLAAVGEGQRIIATFHPEVWVDDYAVEVAPGPTNIDVTSEILRMGKTKALQLIDNHHDTDELRMAVDSPQWVKEWPGPHHVSCNDSIREYFTLEAYAAAS